MANNRSGENSRESDTLSASAEEASARLVADRTPMPRKTASPPPAARRVSLKMLAEHLDLSPATVSFVLNNAPGRSIPPATRERVKAAAKKFGYQPSQIARSLQGLTTQTIGILLPELGEGYHSLVLS